MHKYIQLICFGLLMGGMNAQANISQNHIIYLKWNQILSPSLEGDRWKTGESDLDEVLDRFKVRQLRPAVVMKLEKDPIGLRRVLRLELESAEDSASLISVLRRLPKCEYAVNAPQRKTADVIIKGSSRGISNVPGDPLYPEQWFFPIMQAPSAWDLTHGSPTVVVAVVDNGTDWEHVDMSANIWSNSLESPNNGIDDDLNGFIDDIRGWDFIGNDNDPAPGGEDYHGTHTAGLVSAMMNNGRGVVGMAPSCKLMPLRCGSGDYITAGIDGILYAAHNGADVISLSWGGTSSNPWEQEVINDALLVGAVIVAAAGNEHSTIAHYPAAYEGVMAIAATDLNDELWNAGSIGSNYGPWITVCAPGVSILSLVPEGYGTSSGTSMSTPLVAGIAALVKSYHPSWTNDQIVSQIVNTANDIYPKNPSYIGDLGSGRVNAYRALAETAPGIQIADVSFAEISGDGDAKIDPGEIFAVILSLQNIGETTWDVNVTLNNDDIVQVTQGTWDLGQLNAGEIANNFANPFTISLIPGSYRNIQADLLFTVESENFYEGTLTETFWIDPGHADHDTGNVIFTITDFGAFGYFNPDIEQSFGSGFRYPPEGSNALFHGSLMAGVSTEKVSDCAYGSYLYRYDWAVVSGNGIEIIPGNQADQEGYAIYQDTRPPVNEQVGLRVTQQSYAWNQPGWEDFVILAFTLQNVSGDPLENLYVGLYMDWDLVYNTQNEADWDSLLALGYVYNDQVLAPNQRYYGTCMLSPTPASYRVINHTVIYPFSMTDAQKYQFMTSGFQQTSSTGPADQATLLSAGPFIMNPNDTEEVIFAVLGGDNLVDLQNNVLAAQEALNSITIALNGDNKFTAPQKFRIDTVYPRPSNGEIHLSFTLPGPGEVSFTLVDMLGRSIPFWRGFYSAGGVHNLSLPQWNGASGVYFLRGVTPYGSSAIKVLWMK